jgi:hypothetical protein
VASCDLAPIKHSQSFYVDATLASFGVMQNLMKVHALLSSSHSAMPWMLNTCFFWGNAKSNESACFALK